MFRRISSARGQAAAAPKTLASRKTSPSVFSTDVHVLGNIVSDGMLDFDGTVDGNIRCASLVVRRNGIVNGEVHADTVQVFGRVKGLIRARHVHLQSGCTVEGIVMHETIAIDDGAVIDGKIKRTNKAVATNAAGPALTSDEEFIRYDEFTEEEPEEDTAEGSDTLHMLENIRLIAG